MTATENESQELQRLKRECQSMAALLKQLDREERELILQNKILAREALLCGYQPHLLEPPAPKRRRMTGKGKSSSPGNTGAASENV